MNDLAPLVLPEINQLQKELESSLPETCDRATLKVVMHYEEGSVGSSHVLHPVDSPDDFIDLPTEVFQLTALIERKTRAAGQPWREMTVDADRRHQGAWEFEVAFIPRAA